MLLLYFLVMRHEGEICLFLPSDLSPRFHMEGGGSEGENEKSPYQDAPIRGLCGIPVGSKDCVWGEPLLPSTYKPLTLPTEPSPSSSPTSLLPSPCGLA